ncbi:hypothetical protein ACWDX6_11690 [Streptomyces sp. NPDC003027]
MSRRGPGMDQAKAGRDGKGGENGGGETAKRLDLSVAQVSGSAIAAVVAAKLASTLGVYGTILGAGVISVIATCGGSVFQHLFKRTGEQIRVVAVQAEPVKASPRPARRAAPDRTRVPPAAGEPAAPPNDGEFGLPTTHGTRVRGWKRSAVAAGVVFLVSMGGITGYELISDQDLSGTRGTTTFGSVVGRGAQGSSPGAPATGRTPGAESGTESGTERRRNQEPEQEEGQDSEQGGGGRPPEAGRSTPDPAPTPSEPTGGGPAPTPTPTPSTATPTPAPTGSPSGGAPVPGAPPPTTAG